MKKDNSTLEEQANYDENEEKDKSHSIWLFWTQRRYILTFMLMMGSVIMFSLRSNLSVAIIQMTSNITDHNGNILKVADFDWNSKEQGIILSSFFYGSTITQIPGGILSKRVNGARLYGIAIGLTSILTILTPLAAHNFYTMVGIRTLMGLLLGVTFPVQMALISKWAPVKERAQMAMFVNSGLCYGTVIGLQFSGIICDYINWEFAFYIFGVAGLIWYVFWLVIIKETPEKDTKITEQEKRLILSSIGDQGKRDIKIPWMDIFMSVPVWALIAAHFLHSWPSYMLMMHLPTFFSQIMDIQLSKTGFFSCVPFLINGVVGSFSGILSDKLLSKGNLTVIQTRKLFTCVSFVIQAIFLLGVTFFMTPIASMVMLSVEIAFSAFTLTGFWINFIDIAPQFTGIIVAISNTIATLSGIIAPTLTGFIVQNGVVEEWKIVFYISAGVCLLGAIMYGLMAEGDLQPWAVIPVEDERKSIEMEEKKEMISNKNES
uniref:Sialin n=1 Tax=Culicoides sonorensis TaxID=179676 RepID=A0A336LAC8_CULSO